ncbi:MAG TPA: M23 family metallopeptidase [Myxococcota bacterium]|nr:M23 family metallopeptidase [Myxococcota bacterium]HRY95259.1 M23 family metallopeptidase [Myxococcota bacterium]HSA22460.1 M23 family metallopeptidase [Myxococcota bacterium]
MSKRFTVMIVPDRTSTVRRFRVASSWLWMVAGFFCLLFTAVGLAAWHYARIIHQVSENDELRQKNVELRSELLVLHEKVSSVQSILDRVQRFDTKLRAITHLQDPKRHLALGPVDSVRTEGGEGVDPGVIDPLILSIGEQPHVAIGLLGQRLDSLVAEAERREGSIRELETYLREQKARLSSTPSVWPTRGWMTSGFGMRQDPYTGKSTMHHGIDISNQLGVPVVAPASGVVTFAGISGGYGKVIVVDHGFGIRTRFAHLEEMEVAVGDRVDRGDKIGGVGNSGRSTGPHLHYEVELNGVTENPMNYILEE